MFKSNDPHYGPKWKVCVHLWSANDDDFHPGAYEELFIRSKDSSEDVLLKMAAHVIFKEMGLTSFSDWVGEHPIGCITFSYATLARQRKDDDAPTWASFFVPDLPIEMEDRMKVIRRPPGSVAVGSTPTEPKVYPPVPERPVINIGEGRKIDRMSIDEILDAASREEPR